MEQLSEIEEFYVPNLPSLETVLVQEHTAETDDFNKLKITQTIYGGVDISVTLDEKWEDEMGTNFYLRFNRKDLSNVREFLLDAAQMINRILQIPDSNLVAEESVE